MMVMAIIEGATGRVGAMTHQLPDLLTVLLGSQGETHRHLVARLRGNFPALRAAGVSDESAGAEVKSIRLAAVGSVQQSRIGSAEPNLFPRLAHLRDVASV